MKIINQPKNNLIEILNLKKNFRSKNKIERHEILIKILKITLPITITSEYKDKLSEFLNNVSKYIKRETNKIGIDNHYLDTEIIKLSEFYNYQEDPMYNILVAFSHFYNSITRSESGYSDGYTYEKYDKKVIENCIESLENYFHLKVKKKYLFWGYKIVKK